MNDITERIIGCAIAVHRELGPGLLESVYRQCLAYEFHCARLAFVTEVPVPVEYRAVRLEQGYRLDFLVEGVVIVEIKSVANLLPVHTAQMLTYLRLMGLPVGLLLNFNVRSLPEGIKRIANGYLPEEPGTSPRETQNA